MQKYTVRSDFADEIITLDTKEDAYEHVEKRNNHIKSNYIKVLKEDNTLRKAIGEYVSIEFQDLDDHIVREEAIEAIVDNLKIMENHFKGVLKKILVVGLGNRMITSDALGPMSAAEVLVTAHLYEHERYELLKGTRNVAVLTPGVMGQTGLESLAIVHSVAKEYEPDLIIAVDALATRNIARINRVVQINNTGIQPGSGVGNHRMALSEETLHVPVISIGVATVTSVGAIVKEALDEAEIDKDRVFSYLYDKKRLDLVVTPKSMDDELKQLIYIVSQSINRFLHPDFMNL